MKLKLNALDSLFFRDGRPFTMGEESYAQGTFPPLPSTVRGALRSLWMGQHIDTKGIEQLAIDSNKIELNYFGMAIAGKPVFPAPLDLFFPDHSGDVTSLAAQAMQLIRCDSITSSVQGVTHLFFSGSNGKTESVTKHLLELNTMQKYVNGEDSKGFPTQHLSSYILEEYKTGIGRDNDLHRTKDGLLYRLISNRFHDDPEQTLSLLVDVAHFQTTEPLSSRPIPLGGERRSVVVEQLEENGFALPQKPALKDEYIKICMLTPGLFDSWHPIIADASLVAASIGKPVSVGGWDVLNKQPKPMRRAVPAGSVFIFKAKSTLHANELVDQYHGQSLCNYPDDREGFGICLTAQLFENQNIK